MRPSGSRLPETKALFAALAGGATLERSLAIAAEVSPTHREAFLLAADDLRNDAFRREVIARLQLDPPIAAAILSKARREKLPEIAHIALDALRIDETRDHRAPLLELYLLFASLTALWVIALVRLLLRMVDGT